MQAKSLLMVAALAAAGAFPLDASDRRGHRPDEDRHRGGPNIIIEPEIDLSRSRRPNVDAPEFIMAEIGRCTDAGIRLFVDCLRPNHSPVMIRRLEACISSETIPDEPRRVAACLPPARVR
ncbi:hypothetical protein [Hyphomicrobium sp.]|uniref:hypothetical protein n=1 Tax=Hyphomicrobium sp. TaxID=82 RepID=UPI0025C14488|nr:hypothetical protein [Hyphomicrobium sp.]MCC7250872.1 hypothetical protein [Hyphomicrobium sp.]